MEISTTIYLSFQEEFLSLNYIVKVSSMETIETSVVRWKKSETSVVVHAHCWSVMFSHAPIILAFLCPVLLSSYTRSGSGTRYWFNNAKTSTSVEIRDALDGFATRNIPLRPMAFSLQHCGVLWYSTKRNERKQFVFDETKRNHSYSTKRNETSTVIFYSGNLVLVK